MSGNESDSGVSAHNGVGWGQAQQLHDVLDDLKEDLGILQAAGTSAAVQVDIDGLTTFYNTLSDLHQSMQDHLSYVQSSAGDIHAASAGGLAAGAQDAWTAIAESAGAIPGIPSLHGNMQTIDDLVVSHMDAIAHNVAQYTGQEKNTITALGKASEGDVTPGA